MPKVLIADSLSPQAEAIFRTRGIEVETATGLKPDALKEKMARVDGLVIRSATKVTKDIFAAAPQLQVVGRAGIGVDNVDVPAATARGVVVMNTPAGNSVTTAEHALALIFALAREIPAANASTQAGKWEKTRFMGVELTGKTLGLIGCGNIGAIVADRAIGLRMRVISYDPFLSEERARDLGIEKVDLDALYNRADIITLHVPLTDATRNMIDAAAFTKMKTGVRIVNCARGGLVVEKDLKAAIDSGKVAGAALDVFEVEPAKDNPLFGSDKIVATPHLGASTTEAQEKVALQIAEQMSDFLLHGAITNAVNMPSVTAEEAPKLRPYMKLAELLGSFAGQLTGDGLKAVRIEYEGHVGKLNRRPLTCLALKGLLGPLLESVNMVNAPVIARERNIDITETTHDRPGDYQTLIKLVVTTDRGERSVSGTLFGGDKPRMVEIKGIPVEAEWSPHMLYITNSDKPGMIGALGTLLGNAGINIATFHLGRDREGGTAIALLAVDNAVPANILSQIEAMNGVRQAQALRF